MKKRHSKALLNLANRLPASYEIRLHSEEAPLFVFYQKRDEGSEFPDLPLMTEENKDQIFRIKAGALEQLNHHKRLKKAFANRRTKGVQDYIKSVHHHNIAFAKKNPDLFVEQVEQGLLSIATGKAASFWKSLIAFLFSFVAVFSTKNDTNESMV